MDFLKSSIKWVAAFAVIALLYQNCGSQESSDGSQSSAAFDTNSIESVVAFEKNLHSFLQTSCGSCHQSNDQPIFVDISPQVSHDLVVTQSLVNLGSPFDSRIVAAVARGHYSVPTNFRDFMVDYIEEWADDLRAASRDNNGGGGTTPRPEPIVDPTFQSIYNNILVPKCVKCHSPTGIRPQEDYTSYARTRQTGRVVAGNANASRLYRSCEEGSMPDDIPPLNSQQLGALRDWINNGALDN